MRSRRCGCRGSDEQLVELVATFGRELAIQAPVDLLAGAHPGRGNRSHHAVQAGPHDPLGAQLVERLTEQHRRCVVFQRPLRQPRRERVPLALSACSPAGVRDDRGDVAAAGAPVSLARVARERGRRHADLLANVPSDFRRRIGKPGGDVAEEPQGGELYREADPLDRAAV